MLKVIDVIGSASTGACDGDGSSVTRMKIVGIDCLGSRGLPQGGPCGRRLQYTVRRARPDAYVRRLLPLICLAPDIVEAILDGRQPKGLRLVKMLGNVPLAWDGQKATLGF